MILPLAVRIMKRKNQMSFLRLFTVMGLLVGAVGLSACGSGSSAQGQQMSRTDDPNDEAGDPTVKPTRAQIEGAKNGQLFCNINNECDPAVVMISIATNTTVLRCSGFMISADEILTNSHCVANTYAAARGCSGLIYTHVAAVGSAEAHTIGCQKIEFSSNPTGLESADYAVIKLKQSITDRSPLKLSNRGFNNGEIASVHRVQMLAQSSDDSMNGIQTFANCENVQKTMFYRSASPNTPINTFAGCLVQHGNSGSPMVNSDGEVSAVLQSFLQPNNSDAAGMAQANALALDSSFEPTIIGTQVHCISNFFPGNHCDEPAPDNFSPLPFAMTAQLANDALPTPSAGMEWRLASGLGESTIKAHDRFVLTPSCVAPTQLKASETFPVMVFERGLNSRFQAEWRSVYHPGEMSIAFTASPGKGVAEYGSSDVGFVDVPYCQ
jgi:V8-like Glu-specific endopeptidase